MTTKRLRIATRKSPLALWQATHVGKEIKSQWPTIEIELIPMQTTGDKFLKNPLLEVGGKGLFVKELEEALLAQRADIAVHSMKDVPATFPEGLMLNTICKRAKPLDALITKAQKKLNELHKNAIVGTTSLRRQSQLLALRPDLRVKPLRGNINTRLKKLEDGEFDAIILAAAGLERLGLQAHISQVLDEELMLPACGQGALGIESRCNDFEIHAFLEPLNHPLTFLCVQSERKVNALLGGNCQLPLAVYCTPLEEDQLLLRAKVFTADGKKVISDKRSGPQTQAQELAHDCAAALLAKGAAEFLSPL